MNHPLLTKWLTDACRQHNENLHYADDPLMHEYAAAVIAAGNEAGEADLLEAALDVCQYPLCGDPLSGRRHREAHREPHEPLHLCHPFVPLGADRE